MSRRRRDAVVGRTLLVMGASRGLGLEIARQAASRGANVGLCARHHDRLTVAAADVATHGARVHAEPCDVRSASEVQQAVDGVAQALGPIDFVVVAAGIITVGPLSAQHRQDVRDAMDTMFWGVLNTVDAALPSMAARRRGSIAIVSSIGGRIAVPHLLAYNAAKFATTGLSEGLRAELAPLGIRVTTVVPGLMRTGSHVDAVFAGHPREQYGWFSLGASLPLISVPVSRAARIILDAMERGAPHVSVGWTAALAQRVHGLAPATTMRALTLAGRVLPGDDGVPADRRRGREARSPLSDSILTRLGRRAARRQLQPLDLPAEPAVSPD